MCEGQVAAASNTLVTQFQKQDDRRRQVLAVGGQSKSDLRGL